MLQNNGRPYLFSQATSLSPNYLGTTSDALSSHRAEYEFALKPNWDGKGAAAITSQVIKLARLILQKYAAAKYLAEMSPKKDGSISFVWDDSSGNYVYLNIGPQDFIHLYSDVVGQPKWEGVSVASDSAMVERVSRALRFSREAAQVDSGWIAISAHDRNESTYARRWWNSGRTGYGPLVPAYS